MRNRSAAALTAIVLLATACGGGNKDLQDGSALGSADSLVPVADEPRLPDTTPPSPPETVFVDRPAPPPVTASRPSRTPPPAPRPTPPKNTTTTPPPAPAASTGRTLSSGTAIRTTMIDSVHSHYNQVGDQIRLRVVGDYSDADGRVVIPAGSVITMTIAELERAPNRNSTGQLVLSGRSVTINGESHPLVAQSTDFDYELRARGVGTGEVAKTGAGAVAGGILGRVIGGKKGTVVGAIGGAAAGAAVASTTADRDIIVHAGKPMTITLRDAFHTS